MGRGGDDVDVREDPDRRLRALGVVRARPRDRGERAGDPVVRGARRDREEGEVDPVGGELPDVHALPAADPDDAVRLGGGLDDALDVAHVRGVDLHPLHGGVYRLRDDAPHLLLDVHPRGYDRGPLPGRELDEVTELPEDPVAYPDPPRKLHRVGAQRHRLSTLATPRIKTSQPRRLRAARSSRFMQRLIKRRRATIFRPLPRAFRMHIQSIIDTDRER